MCTLQYPQQPSVRTRRSNGSTNDGTFLDILKSFGNGSSTKSILKKISAEVAQLLLAHAFQVYYTLTCQTYILPSYCFHLYFVLHYITCIAKIVILNRAISVNACYLYKIGIQHLLF